MKLVDLTLEIYDGLQTFSSHPKITVLDHVTFSFSKPRYQPPCEGFASKLLLMSDHSGTHVDAPSHFIKDGKSIERVDPARLIGRGLYFDCSDKEPATVVDAEMLSRKATEYGVTIQEGDIVLIRTWPGEWGEPGFHEWQGLGESAALWLKDRGAKVIGVDLGLADEVGHPGRPVHMSMLGAEVLLIENLINLDQLPRHPFLFIGLPLKVRGATASPIRAVAVVDWEGFQWQGL